MKKQVASDQDQFVVLESGNRPLLLKGKRALITGGTSGIGKEIALEFAREGAHVAILGRNVKRAQETFRQIEEQCASLEEQKVWVDTVDVSKKSEVDKSVERLLKAWDGGIDLLVNNAGITRDKLLMRMEEEDWDEVIQTNLKSVYIMCRAVIRPMVKARYGKIINIASVVGLMGNPGQVNYAASKLGVIGLTKSLAKELATRGVCVNAIAPGFIQTPMTERLNEQQREAVLKQIPMGRFGSARDIAQAALFLASDHANYITGQVLAVDGGMLA